MFRSLFSAMGVAALLAAPAAVFPQVEKAPTDDQSILAKVEAELVDENLAGVSVSVKDRAVTLSGTVPSRRAARRAVQLAEHVVDDEDGKVVSRLTVTASDDDEALAQAVAEKLAEPVSYDVFDSVDVEAKDGVVTLRGVMTQSGSAKELAQRAAGVPGVRQVVNEVQMLSPSLMDDELRLRIARAIYSDPVFSSYAALGRAPVHIVVHRSRVRLTGVVSSELERAKAEAIARSIPGSFEVVNRLRVEK